MKSLLYHVTLAAIINSLMHMHFVTYLKCNLYMLAKNNIYHSMTNHSKHTSSKFSFLFKSLSYSVVSCWSPLAHVSLR